MKTNYSTTISMSIEDGEAFIKSGESRPVFSMYGKELGYITAEYFRRNRYIKNARDSGLPVYVSRFISKSPSWK